jgi:predicted RNA methylase
VKTELFNRNLLSENFEQLLLEKVNEISELKSELEKYKMSEKLATSILESPYNYNNA